jgi:hypothetical protein
MEQHYITKLLLREHTYHYIFYIAQIPKTRASRLYRMKPVDCVLKLDMIPNLVEILIQLHTELASPTWVTVYSHNESFCLLLLHGAHIFYRQYTGSM